MVIESATDVDVFSFTTNRSGPIQVSVSKEVGSNLDTIVSILDASGNVLASNDDSIGTTNSTVVFQADNNTLYYIRVSGYGGTIGRFDISVTDLTPTVAETDGAGTDLNHATALTFVACSASNQGNISSAGDQDFFSITTSSSGVLTISLAAGASSGLDTYLYLYNSDKVLILEDDDSGSDLNSSISINVLTGQTYYLQASGFGSSTGAYTISASISQQMIMPTKPVKVQRDWLFLQLTPSVIRRVPSIHQQIMMCFYIKQPLMVPSPSMLLQQIIVLLTLTFLFMIPPGTFCLITMMVIPAPIELV